MQSVMNAPRLLKRRSGRPTLTSLFWHWSERCTDLVPLWSPAEVNLLHLTRQVVCVAVLSYGVIRRWLDRCWGEGVARWFFYNTENSARLGITGSPTASFTRRYSEIQVYWLELLVVGKYRQHDVEAVWPHVTITVNSGKATTTTATANNNNNKHCS